MSFNIVNWDWKNENSPGGQSGSASTPRVEDSLKVYVKSEDHDHDQGLKFQIHKVFYEFGIKSSLEGFIADPSAKPYVIRFTSDQNIEDTLKNKDLSSSENNTLIQEYGVYGKEKSRLFFDILNKLKITKEDDRETFVTFAGPIVDLLMAPQLSNAWFKDSDSWHLLAQRAPNGLIYLRMTDQADSSNRVNLKSDHSRLNLFRLLTSDDDSKEMDGNDKFFQILEIDFGKNRLIVLKEVDAVDLDGKPLKIT